MLRNSAFHAAPLLRILGQRRRGFKVNRHAAEGEDDGLLGRSTAE